MTARVVNVTVTPTVTAGAYTAKDSVGGLLKFKGASIFQSGFIHSATLTDKALQNAAMKIIIFSSFPSTSTFTDDAAVDIADAEMTKIAGIISIAATDYASFNDNSAAFKGVQSIPYVLDNESQLYVAIMTTGTPTFASTSDVSLTLGFFKDE